MESEMEAIKKIFSSPLIWAFILVVILLNLPSFMKRSPPQQSGETIIMVVTATPEATTQAMPTHTPAPPPTPTPIPSPTPCPKTHTVVKGDTLYSIAESNGTNMQTLVSLNGLTNPNYLYPGQILCLP